MSAVLPRLSPKPVLPQRLHAKEPRPVVDPENDPGPLSFSERDRRRGAHGPPGRWWAGVGPRPAGRRDRHHLDRRGHTDGDRVAARAAWSRPRASGCGCSRSTATTTGWPTTSSATPRCGSLHHGLFDLARRPRVRPPLARGVGRLPAGERRRSPTRWPTSAPDGAAVLVQDYHLAPRRARCWPSDGPTCAPCTSATRRSPGPTCCGCCPTDVAERAARGDGRATTPAGSTPQRWADAFEACCDEVLGRRPPTFVSPARHRRRRHRAASPRHAACDAGRSRRSTQLLGDRRLHRAGSTASSCRRTSLRGFHAFDDLLERHPEWRERVVFGAFVYPSREGLAEYLRLPPGGRGGGRAGQRALGHRRLDADPLRRLRRLPPLGRRACGRYDVLLVNPIRDGLNLVAKEGPLVNERDGRCVLSAPRPARGTSWPTRSWRCTPSTSRGTADVLHRGAGHASGRASGPTPRAAAARSRPRTPADWLADQLAAVGDWPASARAISRRRAPRAAPGRRPGRRPRHRPGR